MNTGPISTRYATALLDYSIEKGEQEEVYARMKFLVAVFLEVPKLRGALQDLSIPSSEKLKIVRTACGDSLPTSLDEMLALIVQNERERYTQFIAQRFIDLYRKRYRLQAGKLVTATPIGKETEGKLLDRIRQVTGDDVEIETIVNPSIIGGFILNLDDYRWDASVAGELERLRHSLTH